MDVDAIFDAVNKASDIKWIMHEIQFKKDQIDSVSRKKCGNCDHWMKSSCKPEKMHGIFKSCEDIGCKGFVIGSGSDSCLKELQDELLELQQEAQRLKVGHSGEKSD